VETPEEKIQLGWPRNVVVANIEMDLREIELDGVDWISPAQDKSRLGALVSTIASCDPVN
jgi:hypothetical protein